MIKNWHKLLMSRQGRTRYSAGTPQLSHTLTGIPPRRGGTQFGVTLVELSVVLVMASVVLALGIPSLQELIQRNRLTGYFKIFAGIYYR